MKNNTKITITLTDGTIYHLNGKESLKDIDQHIKAIFAFNNGYVYCGVTDGEVNEDGYFCLRRTYQRGGASVGLALPFSRLLGWVYEDERQTIITQLEEKFNELGRTKKAEFISNHIELATANAVAKYIKSYLFDVLKDVDNDDYVADYLKQRGYKVTKI